MRKIENYHFGEFVDYENKSHKYVICVITEDYMDLRRLCLGVSFCNPSDIYNEKLGKEIAKGRAKQQPVIGAQPGFITNKMVDLIINTKVEHINRHPNDYIKGYDEAKLKYENKKKSEKDFLELSPEEQSVVNFLRDNPNIDYYKNLAKALD